MQVTLADDAIRVGEHFQITFQRTLRIPDDGRTYPLPPGLGRFPVYRCGSYGAKIAAHLQGEDCYFIPMYQREALWLGFTCTWPPVAVKIAIGGINAISGQLDAGSLHSDPQDYVVCPGQLWLDGINSGPATIRQFVAVPLGSRATVEAAVTGQEETGGIQIEVYSPKPGVELTQPVASPGVRPARQFSPRMGLGAGGRMAQKIYPDPHGIDAWQETAAARLFVHIVNSVHFRDITGTDPPPTPIDARTYNERGLPWFRLYEEHMGDVAAPEVFAKITPVADRDREPGDPTDETIDIDPDNIRPAGEQEL